MLKRFLFPTLASFSGLLFLVTLLSAYGGYFDPQSWTLPSIGVLFFPFLAMATLIVAAVWLIMRRYVIGCIGIGVLLACGPTFIDAMPFRFGNTPSNPSKVFKMVTFNCLHMRDQINPDTDFSRSLHFLIHSNADFICLQELYYIGQPEISVKFQAQIDSLRAVYPYTSSDGSREVEFASKYPFRQIPLKFEQGIKYGNCAAYRLQIASDSLTVFNVHLPSYLLSQDERKIITDARSEGGVKKSIKEFEGSVYSKMKEAFKIRAEVSSAIAEYAASTPGNVIVCGDFNDVPGSWTYRNFTKRGFFDAYAQTGFGHIITYNQHLMLFHIDQILFKGNMMPLYVTKEKMNASDHYPIIAEFEFI